MIKILGLFIYVFFLCTSAKALEDQNIQMIGSDSSGVDCKVSWELRSDKKSAHIIIEFKKRGYNIFVKKNIYKNNFFEAKVLTKTKYHKFYIQSEDNPENSFGGLGYLDVNANIEVNDDLPQSIWVKEVGFGLFSWWEREYSCKDLVFDNSVIPFEFSESDFFNNLR